MAQAVHAAFSSWFSISIIEITPKAEVFAHIHFTSPENPGIYSIHGSAVVQGEREMVLKGKSSHLKLGV